MKNKVVVIAAPPDDEVLGCGATIAKHVKTGDEVHVLIMAEGLTSRNLKRDRNRYQYELCELEQTAHLANKKLGVSSLTLHQFPDNRMDSLELLDVVKVIEAFIGLHRPSVVYTHHNGDVNIDHRIIHNAAVTACRPLPGQVVKTLLFFEIPSSTEWQPPQSAPYFMPNWFIDVSETLAIKLEALDSYKSEMRLWPHPRSLETVKHLAHWRGSIVGVEAAEAFMLGRYIE